MTIRRINMSLVEFRKQRLSTRYRMTSNYLRCSGSGEEKIKTVKPPYSCVALIFMVIQSSQEKRDPH